MSTKTVIISLIAARIIGGAIYFTMANSSTVAMSNDYLSTQAEKSDNSITEDPRIVMVPNKEATNDQIIDYIVDGQSHDETMAAQATLEASGTSTIEEPIIRTNF